MTVVTNSFQKRKLAKLMIQLSQRACDERDFDIALRILRLTETFVSSSMIGCSEKRPVIVLLVAGYELLWTRRNREAMAHRVDTPDPR